MDLCKKLDIMTNENKKKNIGNLAHTWTEKLKNIRTTAKKRQKITGEDLQEAPAVENAPDVPSDSELFASPVYEELTTEQIFVGDEDFFKGLEGDHASGTPHFFDTKRIVSARHEYKQFSTAQKALAAAILLIAFTVLYVKIKSPSEPVANLPDDPSEQIARVDQQTPDLNPPIAQTVRITSEPSQKPLPTLGTTQPLSLKIARNFYLNGDYEQALGVYEQLHQRLSENPIENVMKDFLALQVALCMERTGDYEQANRLLRKIITSKSPVIRVVANYHRGLLEMQKKQYLNARSKAFQAIALIDTIDIEKEWALSLKRDCYFLAAEAITKKILSLCDADKNLPEDLWVNFSAADEPFTHLSETQLRTFLNSGSQHLTQAVLGPQIQQFDPQDGTIRYAVTCSGTSIEELLTRFSANAGIGLIWDLKKDEIGTRKQPVHLHLPSATTWQFVTAVAGGSGLMARRHENGTINISNPALYSDVSDHISMLSEEAVSLWQKFLLRFPEDSRMANIHFALGLLYEQKGMPTESMAEYKLTANRFAHSPLAPFALLNSSKLKTSIRNYFGGCQDLKQLIEQYPDTEISEEAYLCLADSTAKSGLKTEALRLYRKTYNLSLSSESKSIAAMGAGACSYDINDFDSAATWLIRYIKLEDDSKSKDLYSVYFLLGKTYNALNNHEAARKAFKYALQGGPLQLGREQYINTISGLIEIYMQQENFIQALDLLEGIESIALSQEESIETLLLRSKALRAMGLVNNAVAILRDRSEYINDTQLKTKIEFELAKCYIQKDNLDLAQKKLAEILALAEPGPLAHQVALKLGEICLKLGQDSHAVSVCSQLLELQPSEQIKQETLELLAMAYNQQKNYDRAALALLGQWK